MKYLSCQTDTEYYKHLDIRRILFSLSCSSWYILSGVFLFLKWSFLEHPSSNILNLHLILSWDSACIVWPSLLIFFFHFYSFPAEHSVRSLRDSSEGLSLAIFLPRDTKNIFASPLWQWGKAGRGQSNLFFIHLCSTFQWQGTWR